MRKGQRSPGALRDKLAGIKIVVTDVDGVLTDDTFYMTVTSDGEENESYKWYTKDGMGALECMRHDIPVYFITGRNSRTVKRRANQLGVYCLLGIKDKVDAIEKVLKKRKLQWDDVLFIGNDIQDLSLIRRAGIAACPQDAVAEVQIAVDYISFKKGGEGAFRDIAEWMLKEKGFWKKIVNRERTLG